MSKWLARARSENLCRIGVPELPKSPNCPSASNFGDFGTFGTGGRTIESPPEQPLAEAGIEVLARSHNNPEDWMAAFEERAGVLEFDGGMARQQAEHRAFADTKAQLGPPPSGIRATLLDRSGGLDFNYAESKPETRARFRAWKGPVAVPVREPFRPPASYRAAYADLCSGLSGWRGRTALAAGHRRCRAVPSRMGRGGGKAGGASRGAVRPSPDCATLPHRLHGPRLAAQGPARSVAHGH